MCCDVSHDADSRWLGLLVCIVDPCAAWRGFDSIPGDLAVVLELAPNLVIIKVPCSLFLFTYPEGFPEPWVKFGIENLEKLREQACQVAELPPGNVTVSVYLSHPSKGCGHA
jgi:hypothetical protein